METVRESRRSVARNIEPALRTGSANLVNCRICLSSGQHMICIHSAVPEYEEKTLHAMLLSVCFPLNERVTVPGMPEQICRNCKWKLLSSYDLYETTLASDEQLRSPIFTVEVGEDEKARQVKVAAVADSCEQTLPPKIVPTLKRPFTAEETVQQAKKISFSYVKEEARDDSYGELCTSGKVNETTDTFDETVGTAEDSQMEATEVDEAEEQTNSSFLELDESKEGSAPDPLEAFIEEHQQFDEHAGQHVCGLCKQEFAYKSQCRMHIVQKHNPAKPFKCDVCFCTLTSHHRLIRHQIVSHGAGQIKLEDVIKSSPGSVGETTYACPICQKVFNSSVRFKRHKNVHVVHNRPFKCEVCLYRFATKPRLTQHAKLHESKSSSMDSPDPESAGGWYGCDRCEQMFPGKRARTMHLKKVHKVYRLGSGGLRADDQDKNDYSCIICKASFARETVLNTHMKMHELLAAEKDKDKRLDLERMVKQELQQQMLLKVPPMPPLSPEEVDRSNQVLEPFVLGLVPVAKAGAGGGANNNNSATSVNHNPGAMSGGGGGTTSAGTDTVTPKLKESPKSDIAYVCTICEKEFDERELLKKHQKQHPKLNVDIVSSKRGGGSGGNGSGVALSRSMKSFLPRLSAKPGLNVRLINGSPREGNEVPAKMSRSLDMEHPTIIDDSDSLDNDEILAGVMKVQNDSRIILTEDNVASPSGNASPFRCALCNKTFSYNCYLTVHMRKNHDKSKPYACKVCHYRFGYHGTLLRHQLSHSSQNVRPGGHGSIIFKCRICSAKFLELRQLNIHLKTHRNPADDPKRKVQLIRCHECSQIFSDHLQFQQHMAIEHEQETDMMPPEQESRPSQQHVEKYRIGETMHEQRLHGGSSSSLRHAVQRTSSPLTDLKPHSGSRDEEDDSYMNDLSIVKMEPNFD